MSEAHTPDREDRSLQKAIASRIVDEYFEHCESWLRAILRMCIFSLTQIRGKTALVIECPNQAVAKRLSRKTWTLQHFTECFYPDYSTGRVLICYQDKDCAVWRCFDTDTSTWKSWENIQISTASTDS